MQDAPHILDDPRRLLAIGAALGLLLGIGGGASMGMEPVQRGLTVNDLIPPSFDPAEINRMELRAAKLPEHYPLVTQEGVVEVADLGHYARTGELVGAGVEPAFREMPLPFDSATSSGLLPQSLPEPVPASADLAAETQTSPGSRARMVDVATELASRQKVRDAAGG